MRFSFLRGAGGIFPDVVFVAQHQKTHPSGDTGMYGLNHSNSGLTVTEQYQNTQTPIHPTLPAELQGQQLKFSQEGNKGS